MVKRRLLRQQIEPACEPAAVGAEVGAPEGAARIEDERRSATAARHDLHIDHIGKPQQQRCLDESQPVRRRLRQFPQARFSHRQTAHPRRQTIRCNREYRRLDIARRHRAEGLRTGQRIAAVGATLEPGEIDRAKIRALAEGRPKALPEAERRRIEPAHDEDAREKAEAEKSHNRTGENDGAAGRQGDHLRERGPLAGHLAGAGAAAGASAGASIRSILAPSRSFMISSVWDFCATY